MCVQFHRCVQPLSRGVWPCRTALPPGRSQLQCPRDSAHQSGTDSLVFNYGRTLVSFLMYVSSIADTNNGGVDWGRGHASLCIPFKLSEFWTHSVIIFDMRQVLNLIHSFIVYNVVWWRVVSDALATKSCKNVPLCHVSPSACKKLRTVEYLLIFCWAILLKFVSVLATIRKKNWQLTWVYTHFWMHHTLPEWQFAEQNEAQSIFYAGFP